MALIEPAEPPPSVTANCGRCHGVDGEGRGVGAFPKLAGQREDYLYAALSAYAEDRRHSGIMKPLAASLTPEAMREVARYYASLPPPAPASTDTTDAAAVARGEAL